MEEIKMDKKEFLEKCKTLVQNFTIYGESVVSEDKRDLLFLIREEVKNTKIISVEGKHFDHLLRYLDNLWTIAKNIVYKD